MRLIDADALFEAIKKDKIAWRFGVPNTLKLLFDSLRVIIAEQPTIDAVPVVRCYQCKYYAKTMMLCQREDGLGTPDKLDFCSYGERKENNNDC